MIIFMNGAYIDADDAKVSPIDHGLLYGDGVFEGIRAYDGKVFKLAEHVARLYTSAHSFLIPLKEHYSQEEFKEIILETLRKNHLRDSYIRVTVTRGIGLGLDPKSFADKPPTVIVLAANLSLYPEEYYQKGMEVVTVGIRLPRPDAIDPRIKSTGKYINNIWAKFLANQYGAGEGLMLTQDGFVAEATGDNIFIIDHGKIFTPPVHIGILPGITRGTVIDLAREAGIEVEERMMSLFDVYNADEAFLTGTAAEVIAMVKLDGRVIGSGEPGPITRKLTERFHQYARTAGVPL